MLIEKGAIFHDRTATAYEYTLHYKNEQEHGEGQENKMLVMLIDIHVDIIISNTPDALKRALENAGFGVPQKIGEWSVKHELVSDALEELPFVIKGDIPEALDYYMPVVVTYIPVDTKFREVSEQMFMAHYKIEGN